MKTACVTIIFHPEEQTLTNLRSYASFSGPVYVIDNSEGEPGPVARAIGGLSYITYLHDGENRGLGARLNQACTLALAAGCDWILTMDQDSFFDPALLRRYLECAAAFPEKAKVAMFGVGYGKEAAGSDAADGTTASPDSRMTPASPAEPYSCAASDIKQLITSGSLLNLSLFVSIGKFDESLFIDGVDTDYCLKSRAAGFRLVCFDHIVLDHRIGLVSYHRSLKSGAVTPRSLHSPIRLYYMTRNYFYLRRKYQRQFPVDLGEHRRDLLVRIKNNLLYGKKRGAVVRYIVKGVWAYYTGHMNKLS